MTPSQVRALFPALNQYVWLNAAASSPICTPVAEAMRAHLQDSQLHGDLSFPKWLAFKEAVRGRLATFVGAKPVEVAFTPSTSFGFNVAGAMLKERGVREVLTLESEFPSTTLPLMHHGLTLRAVKRRVDGSYPLEDIAEAITTRTGAIAVSLVQFAGGFRVDIDGVAQLAKERGLLLLVNAAQGLGQVPVDFAKWNAAFLAAPSHKWLMAGYGLGLLVIREDLLQERLPMGGWLSVNPPALWDTFGGATHHDEGATFTASGTSFRHEASTLEAGGTGWMGLFALDAALGILEAVTPETIAAHNVRLQQKLREGLAALRLKPNAPADPARMSGSCVVPVKGDPLDVVRALLRDANIVTTPRGGGVRISTHVFNDERDVEAVLEALKRLSVQA